MPIFDFDQDPPAADGEFGFPPAIVDAFTRTANEMNCVIMSRVPGRAATMLIDERYDLKGYFVKAKSCDWGPMAGFICSTPEFSKIEATAENIRGQGRALRDYLKVLWSMDQPHGPGVPVPVVHPHGDAPDDELLPMRDRAFIPVWISAARRQWLEDPHNPGYIDHDVYDAATGYGIAYNAAGTVCLPFWLKPLQQVDHTFALFHGGAYVKAGGGWTLQDPDPFLTPNWPQAHPDETMPAADLARFEDNFRRFLGEWPFPRGEDLALRPVYACQNPFPAHSPTLTGRYRNAFAGDYDLFAVWPVSRRYDLQRVSERDWLPAPGEIRPDERTLPPHAPVFLPVADRAFTVESVRVRGLYVEFIPAQREMDAGLEDQQLGNINQVIADACVRLNSFAAAGYGDGEPPNVAFHSDEGGRHSITAIEWPIGVFVPRQLADDLGLPANAPLAFIFDKRPANDPGSRQNFVKFIAGLVGHCEIPISSGWLWDLMTDFPLRANPSDLAPVIVELLLTGRYVEHPVVANLLPMAMQLIAALSVPPDPPSRIPTAPNTATYTYNRVVAALQLTVPDHMAV